jgi:ubiquitin fusion degradation protein 1
MDQSRQVVPRYAHFNCQDDGTNKDDQAASFSGSGQTLSGRGASSSGGKGKERALSKAVEPTINWGSGQTLNSGSRAKPERTSSSKVGAGGASVPTLPQRKKPPPEPVNRTPSPDWGVDDDDVIEIDSD